MGTGFTYRLQEGEHTFEDFALDCSRAFGALILMRDEPNDATIPDAFEPSDHHVKALAAALQKLAHLQALTPEQAQTERDQAQAEWQRLADVEIAKRRDIRRRYETMLAHVDAWIPPTPEHDGLKDFMQQQLRDSIAFDCDTSYYDKPLLQRDEWLEEEIKHTEWNVNYHREQGQKEIERTNNRNAWLKALRESLAPVTT